MGALICLTLVAAQAIRQETPAWETIGLLVCAAAFVVGCIGLNSRGTEPVTGGIQALEGAVYQTANLLLEKDTLARAASGGGGRRSLDELCTLLEGTIGGSFTGIEVSNDGRDVRLAIWFDGLIEDLAAIRAASGGGNSPQWLELKSNLVALADSIRSLLDAAGYAEARLYFYVMNDQNTERAVLSISDTTIMFDLMEDIWPA